MSLGLAVSYFLLKPAARRGLFALLPVSLVSGLIDIFAGAQPLNRRAQLLGQMSGGLLIAALVLLAAYRAPRNKLAFRIEVSDAELAMLYRHLSNATALRSAVYGALSLLVPLLGLFSLGLGVAALRRVNPRKHPPVGGAGLAITGIVLSCAGLLFWVTLAIFWVLRHRT